MKPNTIRNTVNNTTNNSDNESNRSENQKNYGLNELHSIRQDGTIITFNKNMPPPIIKYSINKHLVSAHNKADETYEDIPKNDEYTAISAEMEATDKHNNMSISSHKEEINSDTNYIDLLLNKLKEFSILFIKNDILNYNKELLVKSFDQAFIVFRSENEGDYELNSARLSIYKTRYNINKIADFLSCFDSKKNTYNINFDKINNLAEQLNNAAEDISNRLDNLFEDRRFRLGLELYIASDNLNEVFEGLLSNSGNEDGHTLFDLLHPYNFMRNRLHEVAKKEDASLDDKVRVYFENTDVLRTIENPLYTALPSFIKGDNNWEARKKNSDKNRYFFKEYTMKELIGGYHRYEAAKDTLITLSDIKPSSKGYQTSELDTLSNIDIFTEYKNYFLHVLKKDSAIIELKNIIDSHVNATITTNLGEYKAVRFEGLLTTGLLARTTNEGVEFKSLHHNEEFKFGSWKDANLALNKREKNVTGVVRNKFINFVKMHTLLSQKDIYPTARERLIIWESSTIRQIVGDRCEISAAPEKCNLDFLYKNIVDNCLADMDYLSKSDLEISTTYWLSWTKDLLTSISIAAIPFGFIGFLIDIAASIPSMIQAATAENTTDKAQFSAEAMTKISAILMGAAIAKLGKRVVDKIGNVKFDKMIKNVTEKISNTPVNAKIEKILSSKLKRSVTDTTVIKNINELINSEDILYKINDYIKNPTDQCFDSVKSIMPVLKEKGYSVRVGATLCWDDIDDVLPENHFFCVITKNDFDYIIDLTGSQYDFIDKSQEGIKSALVLTKDEWINRFKDGFNSSPSYKNSAVKYREFANTSEAEREFGSASFRSAASYIDEQTYYIKRPSWVYKNMNQQIMKGIREVIEECIS